MNMNKTAIPMGKYSRSGMLSLYRRILRLHKAHLPPVMRELGDNYAKAEFRAHKNVTASQAKEFARRWGDYCEEIEDEMDLEPRHTLEDIQVTAPEQLNDAVTYTENKHGLNTQDAREFIGKSLPEKYKRELSEEQKRELNKVFEAAKEVVKDMYAAPEGFSDETRPDIDALNRQQQSIASQTSGSMGGKSSMKK